jgi:two-component system chemotaxis sensor kinase CheA
VTVLWVSADGVELAIPAANAKRVRRNDEDPDGERVPHLAACLQPRLVPRPAFIVDLDGLDRTEHALSDETFSVGVDAIGNTEEVLVRQLSPLLWGIGPYAGAIVRGDGSIRLALDIHALAPRARALGRVPEGRISEPPSRPPPSRRKAS